MATKQRKKQMSDLEIMFDEAYEAATPDARTAKFEQICEQFKLTLNQVTDAYFDYIDSDQFYAKRGI
jgi:hypothetical protein